MDNKHGGCVATLFKESLMLDPRLQPASDWPSLSSWLGWRAMIRRLLDSPLCSKWQMEWAMYPDSFVITPHELYITVDMNFHVDYAQDLNAQKLKGLLDAHGLRVYVTVATWQRRHTLDLVITTNCEEWVTHSVCHLEVADGRGFQCVTISPFFFQCQREKDQLSMQANHLHESTWHWCACFH